MLPTIFRYLLRFVAGILIQQGLRFIMTLATRPRRPPSSPPPRSKPKPAKTKIDPRNIEEGRFEEIEEK